MISSPQPQAWGAPVLEMGITTHPFSKQGTHSEPSPSELTGVLGSDQSPQITQQHARSGRSSRAKPGPGAGGSLRHQGQPGPLPSGAPQLGLKSGSGALRGRDSLWEDPQDLGGWRILGKSGRTEQTGQGLRRGEAGRRAGEQRFLLRGSQRLGGHQFRGEVPVST